MLVKEGIFFKFEHKFVFQIRSDGNHLVWAHGLVPYRNQYEMDLIAHRVMGDVKGLSTDKALSYFERLNSEFN